ncbi:hypothetical protein CIHG_05121 [Coccidioides immitis H538.4]|uniref:Uncharacterized protein n=1 Tax=Coccidioides immitis H538.4 TaxID=396776 RepID=A0A0J8RQ37_COCIT|nr:hypothetical protein CIHG_05121 [Coccidioides immitis H538.4]
MSYLAAKSMACAADKGQESKISPFKQQCALIIGEMPLDGFGVTIRDWGSGLYRCHQVRLTKELRVREVVHPAAWWLFVSTTSLQLATRLCDYDCGGGDDDDDDDDDDGGVPCAKDCPQLCRLEQSLEVDRRAKPSGNPIRHLAIRAEW